MQRSLPKPDNQNSTPQRNMGALRLRIGVWYIAYKCIRNPQNSIGNDLGILFTGNTISFRAVVHA